MFGVDDIIGGVVSIGAKLIDRLIPDPAQKAAAQLELLKMQQSGELAQMTADTELAKGQLAVNQAEAGSSNLFVAGWRPFVGWMCGLGLGFQFIVSPLATWGAGLYGKTVVFPPLDMGTLLTLLFGMLGLGAMRTKEKIEGVATK